ncbi:hypothetical protein ACFQ1S_22840 [Kibdelosporangium lantanae]|uniref:Holin n=1 Tax=Kibdelosporangium lantanae TaxID=1497396 RepID=A0ABW3MC29_9PSEU
MAKPSNVAAVMVGGLVGVSAGSQVLAGFELPMWLQLVFLVATSGTGGVAAWWTARSPVEIKKTLCKVDVLGETAVFGVCRMGYGSRRT